MDLVSCISCAQVVALMTCLVACWQAVTSRHQGVLGKGGQGEVHRFQVPGANADAPPIHAAIKFFVSGVDMCMLGLMAT